MGRLTAPVELSKVGNTIKIVAGGKGYNVANLDVNNFSIVRSGNQGKFFVLAQDKEDFGFSWDDVTLPVTVSPDALQAALVAFKT